MRSATSVEAAAQHRHPTYAGSRPNWELVPPHLIGGIRRYIENGVRPGAFLCSFVSGDLFEAVSRADDNSLAGFRGLSVFLHNYAPMGSFGSSEAMEAWIKRGGLGWKEVHND